MKSIIDSIKKVQAMVEDQMPFIKSRMNELIASKSRDIKEIEQLLDILLDYQFMGVGEKEFKKLNKYYSTFNKQASNDWTRIQKDLLKP
jgi:hypothetical protein